MYQSRSSLNITAMSPDHWSKLTWDTVSAGGYESFISFLVIWSVSKHYWKLCYHHSTSTSPFSFQNLAKLCYDQANQLFIENNFQINFIFFLHFGNLKLYYCLDFQINLQHKLQNNLQNDQIFLYFIWVILSVSRMRPIYLRTISTPKKINNNFFYLYILVILNVNVWAPLMSEGGKPASGCLYTCQTITYSSCPKANSGRTDICRRLQGEMLSLDRSWRVALARAPLCHIFGDLKR